ncbi:hypothetical protein HOE67_03685 [Candidatus Peregrinibacteria bacterium]|jgi:hypothetical protein|nr:hypothetical protein [Candidatus Peregrinibacteria bacterium]MBT4056187.1 hypothetical protein [Candidatus Peregrinibacteria bacterium]
MKKFVAYITIAILILGLGASIYTANAEAPATFGEQLQGILTTPKPNTLPGPTVNSQETAGKVNEWLAERVLPKWTVGMVAFVAVLSFAMLIVSGVRFLTAYGNEEAATSARKMIIWSLAGLLLALFSYTIVSIITSIQF